MQAIKRDIEELFLKRSVTDQEMRDLGPDAVTVLIDMFKHDESPEREWKCRLSLHALGVLGTEKAIGFLIDSADNNRVPGWLRRQAVESMGLTHSPASFAYLSQLAQEHPHDRVRDTAVLALGRIATSPAISILEQVATGDEDASIRERAQRLLQSNEQASNEINQASESDDSTI